MFNLDFQKIHRYLFSTAVNPDTGLPTTGSGMPQPPMLNADNPRSGIHICRETIFTSGSLAFICYARNGLDLAGQLPTDVKLCLKLTAGIKKGRADYGSTRVPGETISFECDLHDCFSIWRVLRGLQTHYSRYLPLPGMQPKSFDFRFQEDASDAFYSSFSEGSVSIRVPFNEGAAMAFQAVIVALIRIRYPHLESHGAISLLDGAAQAATPKASASEREPADVLDERSEANEDLVLNEEGDEEITPGLRKTIYAICLQTWPQGRKDVAQYIQRHASKPMAQRIVDAANRGDFHLLDRISEQVDRT